MNCFCEINRLFTITMNANRFCYDGNFFSGYSCYCAFVNHLYYLLNNFLGVINYWIVNGELANHRPGNCGRQILHWQFLTQELLLR